MKGRDKSVHCIILCGGENSRWGDAGSRKHFVSIDGELLVNRTLRLARTFNPARLVVVVNRRDLDLYASKLCGDVELYGIDPSVGQETEAYKYLSSRDVWNRAGGTVVLLGDVWFSEAAIAKVFRETDEEWTAFGRSGPSGFTGCRWGELFAQRFTSVAEHEKNLLRLDAMYREGICKRVASGWAHYRLMIGGDPNIHFVGPRFVEINDFTDDFDYPEDFDAWLSNYRRWPFEPGTGPVVSQHRKKNKLMRFARKLFRT
jgi:choline kinase